MTSSNPVVQVIFPCGSTVRDLTHLQRGIGFLRDAGFDVRCDEARSKSSHHDFLSAPDELRVEELVAALQNPDIDFLWIAKAGGGSMRISSLLLEAAANLAPKPLIGSGDATILLNLLADRLGWTCFYGPTVVELSTGRFQIDLKASIGILQGESRQIHFRPVRESEPVSGRLMGGNLTVLSSLTGTPFALHPKDPTIWLFEDQGDMPERLDRCARQMHLSGLFQTRSAFWLGDFSLPACHTRTTHDLLGELASPLPAIPHAPAGNNGAVQLLPIGGTVSLSPRDGLLEF